MFGSYKNRLYVLVQNVDTLLFRFGFQSFDKTKIIRFQNYFKKTAIKTKKAAAESLGHRQYSVKSAAKIIKLFIL